MNTVEFLFALFAVFGSTALWFIWLNIAYRFENFKEDNQQRFADKKETIN